MIYLPQDIKNTYMSFLSIVYRCAPIGFTIRLLDMLISASIPYIRIIALSSFIDLTSEVIEGKYTTSVVVVPFTIILLTIVYNHVFWSLMGFINIDIEQKIAKKLRTKLLEKYAMLEYKHIEDDDSWKLISRVGNAPEQVIICGFNNILEILDCFLRLISVLYIITKQVWWLGGAVLIVSVPLFILSMNSGKKVYLADVYANDFTRKSAYLNSILLNRECLEERSVYGYIDFIQKKWKKEYKSVQKINRKVNLKNHISINGSAIIVTILCLCITCLLLVPLFDNKITSGMFISVITSTLELILIVSWTVSNVLKSLSQQKEKLNDIVKVLALTEKNEAISGAYIEPDFILQNIVFKDVSFKYPNSNKYVLRHFNLELKAGTHYAVVGVNGAGKTTLTKLLTGLYDDYEGSILINGIELRKWPYKKIKGIFSVVNQDFAKYSISLKNNVVLGRDIMHEKDSVISQEVYKAVRRAGLESLCDKLPEGIDSTLGKLDEESVDISGGEWQRIAIARLIYSNKSVQILDEPTAALDPISEANVYLLFKEASKNKTTIFITHRLAVSKLVDKIILLNNGKIEEMGTHQTLIELGGMYAEMFKKQSEWYQSN